MDSQKNNNQIIAEKGALDKIEADKKEISDSDKEISDFFNKLKIDELNKKLTILQVDLHMMKYDLQKMLQNNDYRISDIERNIIGNIGEKIWEAKCELSNQILKCEITENHYLLELKRLENELEDQKKHLLILERSENELKYRIKHLQEFAFMLFGLAIVADIAIRLVRG